MRAACCRDVGAGPNLKVSRRDGFPCEAGRRAWAVTVLATVASTYALELFAIAVGALLAGSGLLDGVDRPLLLAFLAASYVGWGAGVSRNLAANW